MTEFIWLPEMAIAVIHDHQIARHGAAAGLRDANLLEAGAVRARNLAAYPDATISEIAAAYTFGIANIPAFVDRNACLARGMARID